MAYGDPQSLHNPATGQVPPATWGDQVRDNDVWFYSGKGAVAATNSTTFSHTSSGNWRNPTFNTEEYDSGASALHSTASNTDRITIVDTGLYMVTASARWDTNATGVRIIGLDYNNTDGAGLLEGYQFAPANAVGTRNTLIYVGRFTAADIVRMSLYQDSTGTRTATVRLTCTWLGG